MLKWLGVVAVIAALVLLPLLHDARFNVLNYDCAMRRQVTLSPNTPGGVHWAEIYLGGWVSKGALTVVGFPNSNGSRVLVPGTDVAAAYVNELYGAVPLDLSPSLGAECQIRVVYRLKSDLSLINPLW